MAGVDERDVGLVLPGECVTWCRAQDYEVVVGDDMARVDLDWWNTRLARHQIPVQLCGRDSDGTPSWTGVGYLRRGDLNDVTLPAQGPADLVVLYRTASWLTGHHDRPHRRHFPDVRTPSADGDGLDVITTALRWCRDHRPMSADPGPYRNHAGWPRTPGVGPALLSLYCWAVHDTAAVARPQLLDPHSVATLVYLGWLEEPSVPHFTATRYRRYDTLLHHWANHAQVPAELIEMWLSQHWRDRTLGSTPNR